MERKTDHQYESPDEDERKRHFQNALSNYTGVMKILGNWCETPHEDEEFPEHWEEDPLLLYGQYLRLLNLDEEETNYWRNETSTFTKKKGPRWVWESRARLAAEIEYLKTF